MWYSNDEPTPTKFRQRTYTIICDDGLTDEEYDLEYKWPIRRTNSQWPTCKFFVMGHDTRSEEYLRKELGVSPARITIFYLDFQTPVNKYHSETKEYSSIFDLEDEIVLYSSHDIMWIPPHCPEGVTSRIKRKRELKNKKCPFIETEPDF